MLTGNRKPTVIEELEQEMKLLHWHKLANEAALKAALIRSKRLKAKDNPVISQTQQQQERALWIQKTLEEEQQKPLQVTDDFVKNHKEKEARDEQRLAAEARASTGGVCCGDEKWLPHVALSPPLCSHRPRTRRHSQAPSFCCNHVSVALPRSAGHCGVRGVRARGEPVSMSARSGPCLHLSSRGVRSSLSPTRRCAADDPTPGNTAEAEGQPAGAGGGEGAASRVQGEEEGPGSPADKT